MADSVNSPLLSDVDSAILHFESGGRNIPNYMFDPTHTAQGYFQITNSTWNDIAPKAGVDLQQYPNAMSAPFGVQLNVAHQLQKERGLAPWTNYNAPLENYLTARGMGTGLMGQQSSSSEPAEMPNFAPIAVQQSALQSPQVTINMNNPAELSSLRNDNNSLMMFQLLSGMMKGHQFTPINYDPWEIAGVASPFKKGSSK